MTFGPATSHGPSWRRRLSKLESMYATIGSALLGAFQFGWLLSLNSVPFNANCDANPIPVGDCLLFAPHSENKWTLAVSAWIAGGAVGAICSGLPADVFGRKKTLGSLATTLETFTIGRLISGVASGVAINELAHIGAFRVH
ncbi:hypothetical protein SPRG_12450 [Saprolegnia parasitica CBS 223.65]|uniref:Major facilitator superfamily (MFS) profile domain-containing protein n=1 Tax=Saprolegnia parasitica (strain CBS 223.65) TaxID=695850 RepID=A0A067BT52_SAPPC|nr:hypothetical protein SPRG_12450 [Saprolegnia parasitica CBS 223.65]KDO21443.1 hypothetical protein SPRG_12450 [Saprolegnia parasitica CBS 223.65]|eukprot:XP_012207889.1 hypothetical protein SPRG_12450 [Saprolegnia parasitica CBS 223.65]